MLLSKEALASLLGALIGSAVTGYVAFMSAKAIEREKREFEISRTRDLQEEDHQAKLVEALLWLVLTHTDCDEVRENIINSCGEFKDKKPSLFQVVAYFDYHPHGGYIDGHHFAAVQKLKNRELIDKFMNSFRNYEKLSRRIEFYNKLKNEYFASMGDRCYQKDGLIYYKTDLERPNDLSRRVNAEKLVENIKGSVEQICDDLLSVQKMLFEVSEFFFGSADFLRVGVGRPLPKDYN